GAGGGLARALRPTTSQGHSRAAVRSWRKRGEPAARVEHRLWPDPAVVKLGDGPDPQSASRVPGGGAAAGPMRTGMRKVWWQRLQALARSAMALRLPS